MQEGADDTWPEPHEHWEGVHLGCAEPIDGKILLVIMDATSKWIGVMVTAAVSSEQAVEVLQGISGRCSIPKYVMADKDHTLDSPSSLFWLPTVLCNTGLPHTNWLQVA